MPQYRYIGPKVLTRPIPPKDAPPPTMQDVKPGDVVEDLTEAEIQAFGDRFEVVGEEGQAQPHEAQTHEARQTRARHE